MGVDDAALVSVENGLVSLNGDGGWPLSDGCEKCLSIVWLDVVDLGGLDLPLRGVLVAATVLSQVGVVSFKFFRMLLRVLHGVLLETSIASQRVSVAIDELLLREADELSSLDEVVTFH